MKEKEKIDDLNGLKEAGDTSTEDPFKDIDEYIANVNKLLEERQLLKPKQDEAEPEVTGEAEEVSEAPEKEQEPEAEQPPEKEQEPEAQQTPEKEQEPEAQQTPEKEQEPETQQPPVKSKKKKGGYVIDKEIKQKDLKGGNSAPTAMKAVGILAMIVVLLGGILMGFAVYQLAINPSYVKENKAEDIVYPYLSTNTDTYEPIEMLSAPVPEATASDADSADSSTEE